MSVLRQVEMLVANGKAMGQACREAGIVEQTYYRWRKGYDDLKVDQAKRLKELEQVNSKYAIDTRSSPVWVCSQPRGTRFNQ